MSRGYTQTLASRAVRILRALAIAGDVGLTLAEVLGELDEEGRRAKARNVTMLKGMRGDGRVGYAAGEAMNSSGKGRPCGCYTITNAGTAWLRRLGFYPGEEEQVLETGAMRGEVGSVTRNQARAGQAPAGAPNWVFSLGDPPASSPPDARAVLEPAAARQRA